MGLKSGLGHGFGNRSRGPLGPTYDADAQAYITATGELFPAALNTLVLGIKAAGLWDNNVGSIKKAIGVPSLAASLVDLRTPSFTGTAVNNPTHSATAGWTFTAASSQYIDSGWACTAIGSKGAQDSVHIGGRYRAYTSGSQTISAVNAIGNFSLAIQQLQSSLQRFHSNDSATANLGGTVVTPVPGSFISTRTGATARAAYMNGSSIASDSQASIAAVTANVFIGARSLDNVADNFASVRISLFHAGAGLDATRAAALNTLFDAYATAAGET